MAENLSRNIWDIFHDSSQNNDPENKNTRVPDREIKTEPDYGDDSTANDYMVAANDDKDRESAGTSKLGAKRGKPGLFSGLAKLKSQFQIPGSLKMSKIPETGVRNEESSEKASPDEINVKDTLDHPSISSPTSEKVEQGLGLNIFSKFNLKSNSSVLDTSVDKAIMIKSEPDTSESSRDKNLDDQNKGIDSSVNIDKTKIANVMKLMKLNPMPGLFSKVTSEDKVKSPDPISDTAILLDTENPNEDTCKDTETCDTGTQNRVTDDTDNEVGTNPSCNLSENKDLEQNAMNENEHLSENVNLDIQINENTKDLETKNDKIYPTGAESEVICEEESQTVNNQQIDDHEKVTPIKQAKKNIRKKTPKKRQARRKSVNKTNSVKLHEVELASDSTLGSVPNTDATSHYHSQDKHKCDEAHSSDVLNVGQIPEKCHDATNQLSDMNLKPKCDEKDIVDVNESSQKTPVVENSDKNESLYEERECSSKLDTHLTRHTSRTRTRSLRYYNSDFVLERNCRSSLTKKHTTPIKQEKTDTEISSGHPVQTNAEIGAGDSTNAKDLNKVSEYEPSDANKDLTDQNMTLIADSSTVKDSKDRSKPCSPLKNIVESDHIKRSPGGNRLGVFSVIADQSSNTSIKPTTQIVHPFALDSPAKPLSISPLSQDPNDHSKHKDNEKLSASACLNFSSTSNQCQSSTRMGIATPILGEARQRPGERSPAKKCRVAQVRPNNAAPSVLSPSRLSLPPSVVFTDLLEPSTTSSKDPNKPGAKSGLNPASNFEEGKETHSFQNPFEKVSVPTTLNTVSSLVRETELPCSPSSLSLLTNNTSSLGDDIPKNDTKDDISPTSTMFDTMVQKLSESLSIADAGKTQGSLVRSPLENVSDAANTESSYKEPKALCNRKLVKTRIRIVDKSNYPVIEPPTKQHTITLDNKTSSIKRIEPKLADSKAEIDSTAEIAIDCNNTTMNAIPVEQSPVPEAQMETPALQTKKKKPQRKSAKKVVIKVEEPDEGQTEKPKVISNDEDSLSSPPRRSRRKTPHKFIAKRGELPSEMIYELLDDDVGIEAVFDCLQAEQMRMKSQDETVSKAKVSPLKNSPPKKAKTLSQQSSSSSNLEEHVKEGNIPDKSKDTNYSITSKEAEDKEENLPRHKHPVASTSPRHVNASKPVTIVESKSKTPSPSKDKVLSTTSIHADHPHDEKSPSPNKSPVKDNTTFATSSFDRSVFMPTTENNLRVLKVSNQYLSKIAMTYKRKVKKCTKKAKRLIKESLSQKLDTLYSTCDERNQSEKRQPNYQIPDDSDIRILDLKQGQSWKDHLQEHRKNCLHFPTILIPKPKKTFKNFHFDLEKRYIKVEDESDAKGYEKRIAHMRPERKSRNAEKVNISSTSPLLNDVDDVLVEKQKKLPTLFTLLQTPIDAPITSTVTTVSDTLIDLTVSDENQDVNTTSHAQRETIQGVTMDFEDLENTNSNVQQNVSNQTEPTNEVIDLSVDSSRRQNNEEAFPQNVTPICIEPISSTACEMLSPAPVFVNADGTEESVLTRPLIVTPLSCNSVDANSSSVMGIPSTPVSMAHRLTSGSVIVRPKPITIIRGVGQNTSPTGASSGSQIIQTPIVVRPIAGSPGVVRTSGSQFTPILMRPQLPVTKIRILPRNPQPIVIEPIPSEVPSRINASIVEIHRNPITPTNNANATPSTSTKGSTQISPNLHLRPQSKKDLTNVIKFSNMLRKSRNGMAPNAMDEIAPVENINNMNSAEDSESFSSDSLLLKSKLLENNNLSKGNFKKELCKILKRNCRTIADRKKREAALRAVLRGNMQATASSFIEEVDIRPTETSMGDMLVRNALHTRARISKMPVISSIDRDLCQALARFVEADSVTYTEAQGDVVALSSDSDIEELGFDEYAKPADLFADLNEQTFLPLAQTLPVLSNEEGNDHSLEVSSGREEPEPQDGDGVKQSNGGGGKKAKGSNDSNDKPTSDKGSAKESSDNSSTNNVQSVKRKGTAAKQSGANANSPTSPKKPNNIPEKQRRKKQQTNQTTKKQTTKEKTKNKNNEKNKSSNVKPLRPVRSPNKRSPASSPIKKSPMGSPNKRSPKRGRSPFKRNARQAKSAAKPRSSRLLKQLCNSDGFIADRQRKNDSLFKDVRELNREERHLQRALMEIAQKEQEEAIETESVKTEKDVQRKLKISKQKRANKLKKRAVKVKRTRKVGVTQDMMPPPTLADKTQKEIKKEPSSDSEGTSVKEDTIILKKKTPKQKAPLTALDSTVLRLQAKLREPVKQPDPSLAEDLDDSKSVSKRNSLKPKKSLTKSKKSALLSVNLNKKNSVKLVPVVKLDDVSIDSAAELFKIKEEVISFGKQDGVDDDVMVTSSRKKKMAAQDGKKRRRSGKEGGFKGVKLFDDVRMSPNMIMPERSSIPSPFQIQRLQDDDAMSQFSVSSTTFSYEGSHVKIPAEVKKVHVVRETGESVLHKASRQGLRDVVLWCCQTGYADPKGQDHAGFAPLHESCATNNIEITRILLAYGADVNVASKKDGIRPLHDAVQSDDIEMVRLLLSCGADPALTTYTGKSIQDMINSHEMRTFIQDCLEEHNSHTDIQPWQFRDFKIEGEDSSDEEEELGQDLFADVPTDSEDDPMALTFECSEHTHVPTYNLTLPGAISSVQYVLLLDILQCLGMSKLEFTAQMKLYIHQMSWIEFSAALPKHSLLPNKCKWMPTDTRKQKFPVDLLRWDSRLRDLLGVDTVRLESPESRRKRTNDSDEFRMTFLEEDVDWSLTTGNAFQDPVSNQLEMHSNSVQLSPVRNSPTKVILRNDTDSDSVTSPVKKANKKKSLKSVQDTAVVSNSVSVKRGANDDLQRISSPTKAKKSRPSATSARAPPGVFEPSDALNNPDNSDMIESSSKLGKAGALKNSPNRKRTVATKSSPDKVNTEVSSPKRARKNLKVKCNSSLNGKSKSAVQSNGVLNNSSSDCDQTPHGNNKSVRTQILDEIKQMEKQCQKAPHFKPEHPFSDAEYELDSSHKQSHYNDVILSNSDEENENYSSKNPNTNASNNSPEINPPPGKIKHTSSLFNIGSLDNKLDNIVKDIAPSTKHYPIDASQNASQKLHAPLESIAKRDRILQPDSPGLHIGHVLSLTTDKSALSDLGYEAMPIDLSVSEKDKTANNEVGIDLTNSPSSDETNRICEENHGDEIDMNPVLPLAGDLNLTEFDFNQDKTYIPSSDSSRNSDSNDVSAKPANVLNNFHRESQDKIDQENGSQHKKASLETTNVKSYVNNSSDNVTKVSSLQKARDVNNATAGSAKLTQSESSLNSGGSPNSFSQANNVHSQNSIGVQNTAESKQASTTKNEDINNSAIISNQATHSSKSIHPNLGLSPLQQLWRQNQQNYPEINPYAYPYSHLDPMLTSRPASPFLNPPRSSSPLVSSPFSSPPPSRPHSATFGFNRPSSPLLPQPPPAHFKNAFDSTFSKNLTARDSYSYRRDHPLFGNNSNSIGRDSSLFGNNPNSNSSLLSHFASRTSSAPAFSDPYYLSYLSKLNEANLKSNYAAQFQHQRGAGDFSHLHNLSPRIASPLLQQPTRPESAPGYGYMSAYQSAYAPGSTSVPGRALSTSVPGSTSVSGSTLSTSVLNLSTNTHGYSQNADLTRYNQNANIPWHQIRSPDIRNNPSPNFSLGSGDATSNPTYKPHYNSGR